MRSHLPARDHGITDLAPALYMLRINGHLGATVLSAFLLEVRQLTRDRKSPELGDSRSP